MLTSRAAAHALVLTAVATLAVTNAFSAPARAVPAAEEPVLAAAQSEAQAPLQPALLPLDPVNSTTQGAAQPRATTLRPGTKLPAWVRATRDVPLWSAPEPDASPLTDLPVTEAFLRPLGGFVDGRLEVYFPGDGKQRTAARAWVDATAVEPSGTPGWIATPSAEPTASLAAAPIKVGDSPAPLVSAWYVAVVDEASGRLLYAEQPHVPVAQASTTKIATTIVALERAPNLSQRVRVSISGSAMSARDGSSVMGIEPGHVVSLEALLYGMMLPSGNDAAEQVALALADSREEYVGWMNELAVALGLTETHFANPSGMDAAGHFSSAYDMAMLARYAMRNPTFRELAAARVTELDGYRLYNLNRLIDVYPGADGIKIGFTDAAQKTMVASAVRDGRRVYVSVLHSANLVADTSALFDWVWENFEWQ
jgi:D-alanyl-D-alanine carboxypeptidase